MDLADIVALGHLLSARERNVLHRDISHRSWIHVIDVLAATAATILAMVPTDPTTRPVVVINTRGDFHRTAWHEDMEIHQAGITFVIIPAV